MHLHKPWVWNCRRFRILPHSHSSTTTAYSSARDSSSGASVTVVSLYKVVDGSASCPFEGVWHKSSCPYDAVKPKRASNALKNVAKSKTRHIRLWMSFTRLYLLYLLWETYSHLSNTYTLQEVYDPFQHTYLRAEKIRSCSWLAYKATSNISRAPCEPCSSPVPPSYGILYPCTGDAIHSRYLTAIYPDYMQWDSISVWKNDESLKPFFHSACELKKQLLARRTFDAEKRHAYTSQSRSESASHSV